LADGNGKEIVGKGKRCYNFPRSPTFFSEMGILNRGKCIIASGDGRASDHWLISFKMMMMMMAQCILFVSYRNF